MKIQVLRVDGQAETLTLVGPVIAREGALGGRSSLDTVIGARHFFRQQDGLYEGWSTSCEYDFGSDAERKAFIEDTEKDRKIHEL